MGDWKESRTTRLDSHLRTVAGALKRCPLCGAINALQNEECFVCTWRGEFDRSAINVEEGLGELLVRCPELVEAMIESPPAKLTFVNRLRVFWTTLRNRSSRRNRAV